MMNEPKLSNDESKEIKRGLILATHSSSWKYDSKKSQFWMYCKTERDAHLIIEKLPQLTQLSIQRTSEGSKPILLWSHTQSTHYTQEMEVLKQDNVNLFQFHQVFMTRRPDLTAEAELEALDALRLTGLFENTMNPNRQEFNRGIAKLRELGVHDDPYSRTLNSFPPNPGGITTINLSGQNNNTLDMNRN